LGEFASQDDFLEWLFLVEVFQGVEGGEDFHAVAEGVEVASVCGDEAQDAFFLGVFEACGELVAVVAGEGGDADDDSGDDFVVLGELAVVASGDDVITDEVEEESFAKDDGDGDACAGEEAFAWDDSEEEAADQPREVVAEAEGADEAEIVVGYRVIPEGTVVP